MVFNPTDTELIRRVLQDNDSQAFGMLMKRYSSSVYGAAIRLMKDEENAADVAQSAFIQAYKQLSTWRGENFGAWVSIIANHIALRQLEKFKKTAAEPLDENTDSPDEGYDAEKEQRLQALETAVAQLPEQERQIIQWHYYESVPLAEIAERLGQTENNVKVKVFRIREKLKKKLNAEA